MHDLCGNCNQSSQTLIQHSKVTGNDLFCEECTRLMTKTLIKLKGYCPVCGMMSPYHYQCLYEMLETILQKEKNNYKEIES